MFKLGEWVIGVAIAAVIVWGIILNKPPKTTAAPETAAAPAVVPRWIHEDVIVTTKATGTSIKGLADFRFTIENKYDYGIKDVRIRCSYFAKSDTELGSVDTVAYEKIPARSKRTVAQVTLSFHSQAETYRCEAQAYRRT